MCLWLDEAEEGVSLCVSRALRHQAQVCETKRKEYIQISNREYTDTSTADKRIANIPTEVSTFQVIGMQALEPEFMQQQKSLPIDAGVYELAVQIEDDPVIVVNAGSTTDIFRRTYDHLRDKGPLQMILAIIKTLTYNTGLRVRVLIRYALTGHYRLAEAQLLDSFNYFGNTTDNNVARYDDFRQLCIQHLRAKVVVLLFFRGWMHVG